MGLFNKQPKYTIDQGTCLFIDEVGAPQHRLFKIIPKQSNPKEVVLDFGNNELYSIEKKFIRAKRLTMYKLPNGNISVQDPNEFTKVIDLKGAGIKELRMNLQNFGVQEGKAALNRWMPPLKTLDKLLPLFKLLFVCIAIGVIGWAAFKGGIYLLELVTKSRIIDCASLIPKQPLPIGVSNFTMPLGA
jgi:hypothetical protein